MTADADEDSWLTALCEHVEAKPGVLLRFVQEDLAGRLAIWPHRVTLSQAWPQNIWRSL